MELIVDPNFCDEILGVIQTSKFFPPCLILVYIHTLFNTPIICLLLLNEMVLRFKIWPRCVALNSLQFHKHFGI